MLGKGLESLIPKKERDNHDNVPSDVEFGSQKVSEGTGRPPAPAAGGDLDSRHDDSPINRGDQSHRGSETFPTTPSESRKNPKSPTESVFQIEVDKIKPNPHQPRRNFDEEALKELALSIREFGIIQPLVVSKVESENESGTSVEYELIAGERRLLAARMAGLNTVPAIVRRPAMEREKLELAVIENIQRADLNPIETARAFARLQDEFRLTQREIAAKVGKSREVVANSVRLLNLPSEIQEAVSSGRVNESQARLLLAVEDIVGQRKLFEEILKNNLSVREIRSRVRNIKDSGVSQTTESNERIRDPEVQALKEQLEEFLGTKVDVNRFGEGGKLTISFYSSEELKAITDKLLRQNGIQSL